MNPDPAAGRPDSSIRIADIPPPHHAGGNATISIVSSAAGLQELLTTQTLRDRSGQLLLAVRRPAHALACTSAFQQSGSELTCVHWILTDPVITADQIEELSLLAARSTVHVVVDHFQHVEWIRKAAVTANTTIGVLIQVDPGDGPGGLRPGHDTGDLARAAEQLTNVQVSGLAVQYPGARFHDDSNAFRDRTSAVISSCSILLQQITQRNAATVLIDFPTGSHHFTTAAHVLQEAFSVEHAPEEAASGPQLHVRSRPSLGVCILDAGRKTPGIPLLPKITAPAGATVRHVFDHHIEVVVADAALDLRIGDSVTIQTEFIHQHHEDVAESSMPSVPGSAASRAASATPAHDSKGNNQSPSQRPPE